jgi:hypothetical protein
MDLICGKFYHRFKFPNNLDQSLYGFFELTVNKLMWNGHKNLEIARVGWFYGPRRQEFVSLNEATKNEIRSFWLQSICAPECEDLRIVQRAVRVVIKDLWWSNNYQWLKKGEEKTTRYYEPPLIEIFLTMN